MEFRILGPLEVLDADRAVPLPRGRGRALLALLVLHAGEVLSAERLIHELWGEAPPPTAATALQGLVSDLRKRLEPARTAGVRPAVIETRPPGYVLAVDPRQIDANRFRPLLQEAMGAAADERSARLREALSLWRGPPLAEFTYEPFAQTAIAGLDELRLSAIEERIDADLALGRHGELVAELEALAAEHPLRERLRGQLMLALYRAGRQAEALEVYRELRRTLVEELGIEPGPQLAQLEQAILRQEPSLDHAPPRAPVEPAPGAERRRWLPSGRKTVTAVVVGFTAVGATPDPESLQPIVKQYVETAADVLARHGATVERFIGDVVVGVFGVPTAHEDDALRAVRAASDLSRAVTALDEELGSDREIRMATRTGIDTGEVLVEEPGSEALVSGEAFRVAAQLQQAANAEEVLLGEQVRRLVRDAVLLEAVTDPTLYGTGDRAWRLLDIIPGAPAVARRFDAPMVGRTSELDRLRALFARTVAKQRARRFTVVGDAGIGKSKLAVEFAAAVGPAALVLTGHCPAYGEGITFWPLREIVLQATGGNGREGLVKLLAGQDDAEAIADQIAGAIGLTKQPTRADKLVPGVRALFERLAARRPVVLVLEDVHWAQPTLLDLVDYLAEWTRAPVFILCLARPELLSERPAWGDAASLHLDPLAPEDTEKLLADRLAGRTLQAETLARIVETAQGNPLFAEQLLAAVSEGDQFSIPASVQALLAARLDRLGPAERDLLRCASVTGAEFSTEALAALLPEEAGPFIGRHLEALERKELIAASRQASSTPEGFAFRHVLIQLAAYRSITRQVRAQLHERFADWLDRAADGPAGFEEIVGYHLEQAYVHRRELGLLDAHSRALARRAGDRLINAGRRAYSRFDVTAAENLWSRATVLLPQDHPELSGIRRHLAEAYQVLGRHDEADALLVAMQEDSPALDQEIRIERARIRLIRGPDPVPLHAIRQEAERALTVFGRSGNEAGSATACYVLWLVHDRLGEMREMEQTARRGLAHAQRSGEPREEAATRVMVAEALLLGEAPVAECIRECGELVRWRGTEHPLVLANVASLRAMLGDFPDARELIARARRRMVERIRARRPLMFVARSSASVEMLAGDVVAAERELRTALQMAIDMSEQEWVSQFAAGLAHLLAAAGLPEAATFSSLSIETAPVETVAAQALWRVAQSRVVLNRGERVESERLAREAVDLVPREMPNLLGDVLVNLAEILLATGQRDAALPVVGEAIEAYDRKGNLVSAARARSLAQ
jgi:DNA-binding SARP family transcriptional activator/class 3 adenylate cyclase